MPNSTIRERIHSINQELMAQAANSPLGIPCPELIAVSKGHDAKAIGEALSAGQLHFGENKVQEAEGKWPALKATHPALTLHLIGALQSNKAADAVALFDVIHTVDREKIAAALAHEMKVQGKNLPCFVQVNTGEEPQKAGVSPMEADAFIAHCKTLGLNIVGLMCIPPADIPASPHFALLATIAKRNGLAELSMGMSADYLEAARLGATYVRVGTAIFGCR